jgi:hypothetical protein
MSDAESGSGILRLRRTIPLLFGEKNLTQVPKLKIVLVLVLDLLGLCVETRPQFSRANSLHERDAEVTRLLEHEQEQVCRKSGPSIFLYQPMLQGISETNRISHWPASLGVDSVLAVSVPCSYARRPGPGCCLFLHERHPGQRRHLDP